MKTKMKTKMKTNTIHNENCLDTMAKMQDNVIDLTITSPPYDNLRTYKGYSFDFESIAKELYRVTKKGGVVVWVVGDATIKGSETGTSFKQALFFKECGFRLHDTMIYNKQSAFPPKNRYYQDFEYMFILSKGKPKTFNPLMQKKAFETLKRQDEKKRNNHHNQDKRRDGRKTSHKLTTDFRIKTNIWKYSVGWATMKGSVAFKHPAIFPEQLANDHIVTWSNENDLVYDCFMGSGTTAKMAKLNNRNYIGSESSEEYCKIAEERINKHDLFSQIQIDHFAI